ncbi:MAG: glycogen debranching enzyme N-terminal domain-containing protein [Candidatus Binataceae bacterium]
MHKNAEWLEADGLGGFASGTVGGARTRRYHALLLPATAPPAGRMALVNGIEVSVATAAGDWALSSQNYAPDVVHPDGANRIAEFFPDPWPRWIFALPDGTRIEQGIFARPGHAATIVYWKMVAGRAAI